MLVECTKGNVRGVEGACVLTIELYQPMIKDFTYSCEVSGERPRFMMRKENLLISAFGEIFNLKLAYVCRIGNISS